MHLLIQYLAKDIDDRRRADASRHLLTHRGIAAGPHRSAARRRLAIGLAAVSRASAGAVRRLDACLADDLAGQLASSR
jgi:hypothetical protein